MNQKLFIIGMSLLLLGMLIGVWTLMDLGTTFDAVSSESASPSALASDIDQSIRPMIVGMPAIIVGVVLLVINWWRGRRQRLFARPSS